MFNTFADAGQRYPCVFLASETDMIAARFIQYKTQADCLLNPPLVYFSVRCTGFGNSCTAGDILGIPSRDHH